jgi:hypothetical protein
MKCDEAATFGYPRERSFGTAGQRPLAIRDRRRVERRVTASFQEMPWREYCSAQPAMSATFANKKGPR